MILRAHQTKCKEAITKHFKTDSSALIKMFCGSGKSLIIYDCLIKHGNNLSVVVVPSINLIT
jgi:superfamily II DNA or RNA helicase